MASFLMKQMVGGKLNEMKGGIDKLTGDKDGEGGEKTESGEDPEVVAARLEQEERRKERHRKMEREREKMRQDIRSKYNIQKKEDGIGGIPFDMSMDGRIVGPSIKKTPEQIAQGMEDDDSLIGQLGLTEQVEKAKTAVSEALETVKGFLPFGK
uniref:Putative complexin-1 n=1 Tax=Wuchereria bancrofti TaxID=6293 RepID=A0A1I8EF70_WUCBA